MNSPDKSKGDCFSPEIQNTTTVLDEVDGKPSHADPTETNTDPDTLCGLGSWTPNWLQKAANTKLFLLFYSMAGFTQGASFTYFVGCLSTLEKRFAYDTKKTGLLIISEDIAPIFLGALIGYFGGLADRPRLMTIGMLIGSLGSFIMAFPYFIYGPGNLDQQFQRSVGRISGVNVEFCDKEYNELGESCGQSISTPVLSTFFISVFLKGISCVIFYSIGTTYMDDCVEKKNTPVYLAILFVLRLLGPTVGFLLCSFCLQLYEDPFYDPGFSSKDPRWIGAWWLGFIILGVIILIFSLPMILFPRRFPRKHSSPWPVKKTETSKSSLEQIKEMGKALKRLVKNPILMFHYLGGVLRMNGLFGYYVLLPKYMEMQFKQTASKASLYSGPASLIAMQIGILTGGIGLQKFRPNPRRMTGVLVIIEAVSILTLITCMVITCPGDQFTGASSVANPLFNLQNECNSDCTCSTKVYTPVCGPDGQSTYFSPCFAGCTGYNKTGKQEVFTDCKCVHEVGGQLTTGDAREGYCGMECQTMITFIAVLCIGKLVSSMARVPNALVTLRCVDPEDKSIAMGLSSGVFSLLAFIPYPLIYGNVADSSCLVWEQSCGKTGNCWVYDVDHFRYLLHGVSATFVFLGCATDVFVWIYSSRIKNLYGDGEDGGSHGSVTNSGMLEIVKSETVDKEIHFLNEKPTTV